MSSLPILKADDIFSVEKRALEKGKTAEFLMENAGKALSEEILNIGEEGATYVFLIGKGNNGGDGLCSAKYLMYEGAKVLIYCLFPKEEMSPLGKVHLEVLQKKNATIHFVSSAKDIAFHSHCYIIDAIFGIGFKQEIKGLIFDVIEKVNASRLPVIAIDTPSGLNVDTGKIKPIAIKASITLTLGFPKKGFFINQGFEHIGDLKKIDIGFEEEIKNKHQILGYLLTEEHLKSLLPTIDRCRHKYERGYVLCVASSANMPGAGLLSSLATLRSGAGIVTLFHPKEAAFTLCSSALEVIKRPLEEDLSSFLKEMEKAKALIVGPGFGRDLIALNQMRKVIEASTLPTVLDADALYFLSENPAFPLKKESILTPHKKEMLRLLQKKEPYPSDEEFHSACREYAKKHECIIVLKGAPTWIFSYDQPFFICIFGDPGMATAGSGDVLSGVIGAMLASGLSALDAALFGVGLHGLAGEIAADEKTSYAMIASDIIQRLPSAYLKLLYY